MKFDELRFVCEEAAKDVLASRGRPVPPTVVLPGTDRTRLLTLPEFPDDDEERHDLLAHLAQEQIVEPGVPAWGFLVEGEVDDRDVVVVVYGARKHAPHVTAAPLTGDGLDEFLEPEELDPTALPFLHPLQHAVDSLPALEDAPGPESGGTLPLVDPPTDPSDRAG